MGEKKLSWLNPFAWPELLRGEPWRSLLAQANVDLQLARSMAVSLAERCHSQSEILSRRARGEPVVVCLCGSTRFKKEYQQAFMQEEHAGKICLTVPCFKDDPCCKTEKSHAVLDQLHLRKIEMASEVVVIAPHVLRCVVCNRWCFKEEPRPIRDCVCGSGYLRPQRYIGESTTREIEHAMKLGKLIRYHEPQEVPCSTPESTGPAR